MRTITTSLTPLAHCLTTFATAATRRVSAWILAAAVLAAVPGVSDTGGLAAQNPTLSGCLKCVHRRVLDRDDVHWTKSDLLKENGHGYGRDGVHNNVPKEGNCDVIHGICVNVPRLTVRELTRKISGAVAANEIESLVQFAIMPAVSLFAERSALQVLGCDGETIAGHIPINQTLLAEIEAATAELPDSDS